ncbi:DUF4145 domain-containing protein [Microbacterium marmarense]|uniref:DUF4145 domain-containing protein n=1 Tax=Microbacterium marmarense TaxID=3122051 RepID=A0ABU8LR09_9MICO
MAIGSNKRYSEHYDRLMDDRVLSRTAAGGDLQSLAPMELRLDQVPLTIDPTQSRQVKAWVRFGSTPIRVDAAVARWTPGAVGIVFEVDGKAFRCWVWAGAIIEATAKDRGITSGSLVAKINQLHADEHIRKGTKDMAHALRILGNDMAHGDVDEVPTQEDATDALTIARFVLDDVYVADARRADMMARRTTPPAQ